MNTTTPFSETVIRLLGSGLQHKNLTLTRDEMDGLRKLYGFVTEPDGFHRAGADRNLLRQAELDGLRLVAWISKYVTPSQDPLKTLIELAVQAGLAVEPEDVSWCEE